MMERGCVAVGMSGGVDSSVAAALLVEQGYQVIGLMLQLWSEPGKEDQNRCCTPDAMYLARRVCAKLDIPFYAVDSRQHFFTSVVQSFLEGYSSGLTPNPCIACNRAVKWGLLLQQAKALGADHLATGHYARIHSLSDGKVQLLRGVDHYKDQSYFISMLTQDQLSHTLFPLGDYQKTEVREIARKYNLPVAEKRDSQDLCFLGDESYQEFLKRYAPDVVKPGLIINTDGAEVGRHQGLAFFTIGQRKGLELSSHSPLYVIRKDYERNLLVVGHEEELGIYELKAEGVNWISGAPPDEIDDIQVKIRYRGPLSNARITVQNDQTVRVEFKEKMRDITPGQFVVFYNKEVVLGGGMIVK
jgi:tRNA-uridine 2-sulfurtransferase